MAPDVFCVMTVMIFYIFFDAGEIRCNCNPRSIQLIIWDRSQFRDHRVFCLIKCYTDQVEHMGFLLQAQGRLAEAEKFFKRTLRGREKQLGANHPDTVTSLHHLASFTQDASDFLFQKFNCCNFVLVWFFNGFVKKKMRCLNRSVAFCVALVFVLIPTDGEK